jgi:hypothetical protein
VVGDGIVGGKRVHIADQLLQAARANNNQVCPEFLGCELAREYRDVQWLAFCYFL